MAISYVIKQRPNPKDRFAPKKWYAFAKAEREQSYQTICDKIARASTATKGDVDVALNGVIFQIVDGLADGDIVRLGDFGSFRVSVSSGPSEKKEDFHSGLISKAKVLFTPGPLLKAMLKNPLFRLSILEDKMSEKVTPPVEPDTTEV